MCIRRWARSRRRFIRPRRCATRCWQLTDFDYINARHGRLTLGAVNVKSGEMHYFDSRDQALDVRHVMASGALPPAFPAVRIDGETYWDGGIYSNTPIEVVLDDKPRRNSLIFSANVWHPTGPEPETIWQVLGRQKDIQFASRVKSHVRRQQQIHRMRHIVRDLARHVPAAKRDDPEVKKLLGYGCATVMHVVPLFAPRIDGEDHTKDIDFTPAGIKARRNAGYADTRARARTGAVEARSRCDGRRHHSSGARMNKIFDAIVIGAGQAGPSLAARLAGAGRKVALVERNRFGGTCVNTGCMPTKTLVASAYAAHLARRAAEYGVMIDAPVRVDMQRVKARKDEVVRNASQGVEQWLKGLPNVSVFEGHARFESPTTRARQRRRAGSRPIFSSMPAAARWCRR